MTAGSNVAAMLDEVPTDKEYYLDPDVRRQVYQRYTKPSNLYGVFHAFWPVAFALYLVSLASSLPAWHAVWLVPAMGLAYYRIYFPLHDLSHYVLFTHKQANRIAGWLLGGLLVTPFETFRREHAYHHAHFGTAKDPGGVDYQVTFKSRAELIRFLLTPLWAGNFFTKLNDYFRQLVGKTRAGVRPDQREKPDTIGYIAIIIVQLGVLGIATNGYAVADWWRYPLFVLLPGMTVFLFLSRLRMFLEHTDIEHAGAEPRKISRTFYCNWLEGLLLSGASFKYHYEHHLLPNVPSCHLAAVNRDYTKTMGDADMFRASYWQAFSALWRKLPA